MNKLRIKEVSISSDGTNTWFYPEVSVSVKKTGGKLWWKKTEVIEEWKRFYISGNNFLIAGSNSLICHNNILGFRTLSESKTWIEAYKKLEKEKIEEENERKWKYVASTVEVKDTTKIHEIK